MKCFKSLFLLVVAWFCLAPAQPVLAEVEPAFTQPELDRMLAPIALYPDTVLSHVLIAATYPLEVVEAARWSRTYPELRGEDAVAAVEDRPWDASVKALVAFPDLIRRMDEDLSWTRDLGEAFLVQEGDVVDSVQYLRNQAYEEGNLVSNERVEVVRETKYIYIEPREPRYVYVPYYDPWVVYGSWRWASYPPVYWPRPHGISVGISLHWGSGFHIAPSFYFSAFHWPHRQVVVVNHHHHHHGYFERPHRAFRSPPRYAGSYEPERWRHDRHHRRNVKYRHAVAEERFHRPEQVRGAGAARSRNRADHAPHSDPGAVAARFSDRKTKHREVARRGSVSGSVRSRTPVAGKGDRAMHRTQPVRRVDPVGGRAKSKLRATDARPDARSGAAAPRLSPRVSERHRTAGPVVTGASRKASAKHPNRMDAGRTVPVERRTAPGRSRPTARAPSPAVTSPRPRAASPGPRSATRGTRAIKPGPRTVESRAPRSAPAPRASKARSVPLERGARAAVKGPGRGNAKGHRTESRR